MGIQLRVTIPSEPVGSDPDPASPRAPDTGLCKTVVLVGLMGAGKTAVGRRLAASLDVPFADADAAITEAAGMSVADIFESYGEAAFRDLERRVVTRLLGSPPMVLALGGGAFIDDTIREAVRRSALSIWLDADLETLVERTSRKKGVRPLLDTGDPRSVLADLLTKRKSIYALADWRFVSSNEPREALVGRIRSRLVAENMTHD